MGQLRREEWKSSHGTSRKVFRRHQMPLRVKSQKTALKDGIFLAKDGRAQSAFLKDTVFRKTVNGRSVAMAIESTHFNTLYGGD